ncbi:MAG: ABC transporter ATP-binding protein [Beijerinckiaceae bacterium]|nr:ABC transporter ATP-binding protein [Beijerinckiaceae bacterium]
MTNRSPGTPEAEEPFITWTGVSVDLSERTVLHDVDLNIGGTDFVAVLGPNGAGKSTLLRAICGLVRSQGGAKAKFRPINGLSNDERRSFFSFLSQDREIAWPMPVRDVVAMGLDNHPGAMIRVSKEDAERMADILWQCGLERLVERPVNTLSGGERSRVLLARALLSKAPFLLADEPTAALDPAGQVKVLELLAERARSGRPVIAVLHDVVLAARFATRAILLERGRKVADGSPLEVVLGKAMTKAFGIAFHMYETGDGPVVALVKPSSEERR